MASLAAWTPGSISHFSEASAATGALDDVTAAGGASEAPGPNPSSAAAALDSTGTATGQEQHRIMNGPLGEARPCENRIQEGQNGQALPEQAAEEAERNAEDLVPNDPFSFLC